MVQWLTNLFSPKQSTKKREKVRKSRRRKSKRKKSRRKSRRRKSRRKSRKRKSMRKSRKRKSMRKSKRRKSMRKSRKRKSKRKSMRKSRKRKSMRKSTTGLSSFQRNLQQKIKTSPWFICTMKGCGYCNEAKKILKSHHQKYRSIALTDKNSEKIWAVTDKLAKEKYRYFPMIFHKGKFFGGYTELKKKFNK